MVASRGSEGTFSARGGDGVLWAGRSGRQYAMTDEPRGHTALATGRLYVLAEKGVARWAGTVRDLVEDQASRARFRKASANGAALFSMPAPADELALMTLVWDIEGTRRLESRDAA